MTHVFFDFDGTLVDSSQGIHLAFQTACAEVGLHSPDLDVFRGFIGPPIQVLAKHLFPDIDPERLEALRLAFRSEYDQRYYALLQWHDGVLEGLHSLAARPKIPLSVVTNKPTSPTNLIIANAGIEHLFSAVVGIDYLCVNSNGLAFANKSQAINFAMAQTCCQPDQAIYVGDTLSDQSASLQSGVRFVAATYGFHRWQAEELDGIAAAHSFEDVIAHLLNMLKLRFDS